MMEVILREQNTYTLLVMMVYNVNLCEMGKISIECWFDVKTYV